MTHSSPTQQTWQVKDKQGHTYQIEKTHLIAAAQDCIRAQLVNDQPELVSAEHSKKLIQVLIAPYEYEVFMAIWLDNKHRVIHHEIMFRGTIDATSVYPREVVKAGLKHNAAAVIFAHNHPSGLTEPSHSDITITRKLKDALALVDIRVLDHMIAGEDVTAMSELGLV